jgi:hypothetical protein
MHVYQSNLYADKMYQSCNHNHISLRITMNHISLRFTLCMRFCGQGLWHLVFAFIERRLSLLASDGPSGRLYDLHKGLDNSVLK